jgi:Polyketide cyclase / dehydrase and lipid transport
MSLPYSFRVSWTVPFPRERVHAVLVDLERYPEWWPQVRAVVSLGEDDALVVARSVLPYSLELVLHAERRDPTHLETTLRGDLEGVVRWYLTDLDPPGIGPRTRMDFEQDVQVTGRLLRLASRAGRPLLTWNHERMMRGCFAGLNDRLDAGRAAM